MLERQPFAAAQDSFWWEGSAGSRVLHIDTKLSIPQRNRITSAVDLLFGPDTLVWAD